MKEKAKEKEITLSEEILKMELDAVTNEVSPSAPLPKESSEIVPEK